MDRLNYSILRLNFNEMLPSLYKHIIYNRIFTQYYKAYLIKPNKTYFEKNP